MGEAKRRGAKTERIRQALEAMRPVPVDELKVRLGLEEKCNYLGYIIHLPKSDEFLALYEESSDIVQKGWTPRPELAIRYDDFQKAVDVLRHVERNDRETVIGILWEDPERYFVTISD